MPILDRVRELLADDQKHAAIALVSQASDHNDVDAIYTLASWHLADELVPRNLTKARHLLRKAVEIGHVDAALLEIALIANGSGAPPDWQAAKALLRKASVADPVAAEQLALLDRMNLTDFGSPVSSPRVEKIGHHPDVYLVREFATKDECAHLAMAARELLAPAVVKRRSKGTPDQRRRGTPFSDMMLVS